MTRPLRFDPAARRELDEAADFYDAEDPGLGLAFLDAAERAFEQIQAFPESSPISLAPVRAKVLSAFPFSVIYWVTDDEVIIVLALAHHRRRPEYWRGRE
jgi:plasmid stabilization system protein ParE